LTIGFGFPFTEHERRIEDDLLANINSSFSLILGGT
jgi:hypothetical protein